MASIRALGIRQALGNVFLAFSRGAPRMPRLHEKCLSSYVSPNCTRPGLHRVASYTKGAFESLYTAPRGTRAAGSTAADVQATCASLGANTGFLQVDFHGTGNGAAQEYPFVWLRDNCQCASCFQPVTKARLILMRNLDLDVVPRSAKIDRDRNELVVIWADGHVSQYPVTWLWERRFDEENMAERDRFRQRAHRVWGAELQNNIPLGDFNTILNDDEALLHWITTLEETGLFLIQGAPLERGQVRRLAERVSFLRTTCYGETFDVFSKAGPSNLAYTSDTLGWHLDQSQYNYMPGMQMLHCIVQTHTEGGENEFADGFHVAEQIRMRDPEAYRILTDTLLDFIDRGRDYYEFYQLSKNPVISLDTNGEIQRINFSSQTRDSYLPLPLNAVKSLYAAMRMFEDLLSDDRNMIRIKLKAGEIVCFHNLRVLHARTAYERADGVERHLEGAYIDWDELRSRRRVLEVKHDLRR